MRSCSSAYIGSLVLLASVMTPLATAQVSNPALNQWTLAAAMNTPRAQACSAILKDGSVLVTGGQATAGPVGTAEIYGTGGTFAVTAPMNQARTNAACATLLDGRVLVMGGDDGSGALRTAEIYDPVLQTWSVTGSMTMAREGHQVALNAWGAVMVAGGTNPNGIAGTLEEFDPRQGTFRTVGTLTTPRSGFAMVSMAKRQVLIAGGTDGSSTIASVEIYNGSLGTVSVAGSLAQARQDFAAALLPDGNVLITGGHDPNGNLLSSTEVFDPVKGVSTTGPNLAVARAYHSAYALTGNGQVVIAGGVGSAGVLSSTETYAPWSGAVLPSAALKTGRRDNVAAFVHPGNLLVAGGRNDSGSLSSSEIFPYVTIGTDKPDYAPGTQVRISGTGWQPGELVSVEIVSAPLDQHGVEFTGSAVADSAGNVTVTGFGVVRSDLARTFILTATGTQLKAQTSFTDGLPFGISFSYSPTSPLVLSNSTPVQVTATVTFTGAPSPTGTFTPCLNDTCAASVTTAGTCHTSGDTYTLPGTSPEACSFTFPISPAGIPLGPTQFGVSYFDISATYTSGLYDDPFLYTVQSGTATTLAPASGSLPYGQTFVATVTPAVTSGNTPTGLVQFSVNNVPSGSPVSLIGTGPFTATFVPSPPLPASLTPYMIKAVYAGNAINAGSDSGNTSYTIAQGTATTTLTAAIGGSTVTSETVGNTVVLTATLGSLAGGVPAGNYAFAYNSGNVPLNQSPANCIGPTSTPVSVALVSGSYVATCQFEFTGPGFSLVNYTAIYGNDANYGASSNADALTTNPFAALQPANTNLTASVGGTVVTAVTVGNFTLLTASLTPLAGITPSGNFTFRAGGSPHVPLNQSPANCVGAASTPVSVVLLSGNYIATCQFEFAGPGSSSIAYTATFANDPNYTGAPTDTLTTVLAPTSTVLSAAVGGTTVTAETVGDIVTLTATLGGVTNGVGSAGVGVQGGGGSSTIAPAGDFTFTYSSGSVPLNQSPANCIGPASTAVTVALVGSNYVATCQFEFAGPGFSSITYTAAFANDSDYANSSNTDALVTHPFPAVQPTNTNVTAAVGGTVVTSETIGNTVVLTASLTPLTGIPPTGNFSFRQGVNAHTPLNQSPGNCVVSGGAPINVVLSGGTYVATCQFEFTGPGAATAVYTANYGNDANYTAVPVDALTTTAAAPTTVLTAAVGGITVTSEAVGSVVTLTATMGGLVSGVAPTGNYTFTYSSGNLPLNQSPANCVGPASTPVSVALVGSNYAATCQFEFAGPGLSSIIYTAVYGNDTNANYLASTNTDTLTTTPFAAVQPANTSLTASVGGTTVTAVTVGNFMVLTASLTPLAGIAPTGNFTFSAGGNAHAPQSQSPINCVTPGGPPVNVIPSVNNYIATCQFVFTGPGSSTVTYTATYGNDVNYTAVPTDALSTVSVSTTTGITAAIGGTTVSSETVGNVVTLTATLGGVITGISSAGKVSVQTPGPSGIAPAGSYTFTYSSGNLPLNQSPANCVGPASTAVNVALVGSNYVATCQFEFAGPGFSSISYTALYGNDTNYSASSNLDALTTNPFAAVQPTNTGLTASLTSGGAVVTSEMVGNTVFLTASLTPLTGIAPTGNFSFQQGGNAHTPLNQSPGNCTVSGGTPINVVLSGSNYVAICQFEFTGPGSSAVTYTATYGNDANYTAVPTDALTTTVAVPTTAVTAAVGGTIVTSEAVGNVVTLTATMGSLASGIAPTGSYTFSYSSGNLPLNQSPANCLGPASTPVNVALAGSSYVAMCQFEFAGPGLSSIAYTAVYGNDTAYGVSTNTNVLATTPFAAVQPTNTNLTASLSSGGAVVSAETVGNTVFLTASLTPILGIVPTGNFTFREGVNAQVPLNQIPANCVGAGSPPINVVLSGGNYIATCQFEFAGPGSSTVMYTATYGNDANYSAIATDTLNSVAYSPVSSLTDNTVLHTETVGQTVTVTASITGLPGITPLGSFTFSQGGNAHTALNPGNPSQAAVCMGVASAQVSLSSGAIYTATCQFEFAGPGASQVIYTATYVNDSNYTTAPTDTLSTALATATSSLVTTPSNTVAIGNTVNLTATVTGLPGIPTTNNLSNLTFTLPVSGVAGSNSTNPAPCVGTPVSLVNQTVSCAFEAYAPSTAPLHASLTFAGDSNFAPITPGTAGAFTTINTTKALTGTVGLTLLTSSPVSGQALSFTVALPAPALVAGSPVYLPAPTAPANGSVTVAGQGVTNPGLSFTLPNVALTSSVVNLVPTSIGAFASGFGANAIPTLPAGVYNLTVTYNGDSNYVGGETGLLTLTIGKAGTVTAFGAANIVTVTAAAPGTGTPTGTVTVYSGDAPTGTPVASGTLSNGTFATVISTGQYIAVYSGDSNFSGSTSQGASISRAPSATTITASLNPAPANQPVVLTATVTGGSGLPTGTVTFSDNNVVIGATSLSGGVASISFTLNAGAHNVTANYGGDSSYASSSGSYVLTVNKPPSIFTFTSNPGVAVYGQSVTLTVNITQSGTAVPTGTLQYFDNGVPVSGAITLAAGAAILTFSNLPVGVHNFTVVYSGDAAYGPFSGIGGSVLVNKAQVSAMLTANTNAGQETVGATVVAIAPGSGTPTGTVQFSDTVTGQMLGTATLSGGITSVSFPVTTDPISGVYSGDANFNAGTAPNVSAVAISNVASGVYNFAAGEIVQLYGTALTTQILSGSATSLGGVTVTIKDSAGVTRTAILFFVSPGQINFLMPSDTANGTGTITLTTENGTFTQTVTVTNSAAGLFTANLDGSGPLAAQLVSVTPGGTQTYTGTAALSGTTYVNVPIVFTPVGDTFYLLLYGTGFDKSKVITATINGQTFTPLYAGPQGTYPGLDQINILLPASLAGSGAVSVTITVDGQASNAGTLVFN